MLSWIASTPLPADRPEFSAHAGWEALASEEITYSFMSRQDVRGTGLCNARE